MECAKPSSSVLSVAVRATAETIQEGCVREEPANAFADVGPRENNLVRNNR